MERPKKICFITGTRADYGILSRLMKAVKDSPKAELQIIATNMHLSPAFGLTVSEIEKDGFNVDAKIESLLASDTPSAIVKSMGLTQIGIADAFQRLKPDLAVILGDRYEMLAAASAALIFRIPVAHLHGGETTEGAVDNQIRHAITKLSALHFPATEEYAQKIISMGEPVENVVVAGALGVEDIPGFEIMKLDELEKEINFSLSPGFIVVTFHPATADKGDPGKQTAELIEALKNIITKGYKILITMPNSDAGSSAVSKLFVDFEKSNPKMVKTVKSLGRKNFFTALGYASAIVGNSSSALIEAPSFRLPAVNIGSRQKGRAKGSTVIDCQPEVAEITEALEKALNPVFKKAISEKSIEILNPYYRKGTLETILNRITEQ